MDAPIPPTTSVNEILQRSYPYFNS
jgi:hypothetical protein